MNLVVFLSVIIAVIFTIRFVGRPKHIKGAVGERIVKNHLNKLDRTKYKVFHDLYIPKKDGSTAQIDHLVLSTYGIFIVETKNFNGRISGEESGQHWTQRIFKRENTFYNPVWQNEGHINALKEFYGDVNKINYYSFVVFTRKSQVELNGSFMKAQVLYTDQLVKAIREQRKQCLKAALVRELAEKLQPLHQVSWGRKKVIQYIHVQTIRKQNSRSAGTCPKCGGALVKRSGKYGEFKGCSRFPKCRFTK